MASTTSSAEGNVKEERKKIGTNGTRIRKKLQ
jgi:hypothetical protein